MGIKEVKYEGVDCVDLAQGSAKGSDAMNKVIDCSVKRGQFLD